MPGRAQFAPVRPSRPESLVRDAGKDAQKVDKATIDYYLEKVEENASLRLHMFEHEKPLDVLSREGGSAAQTELSDEYAAQMGIRSQLDQAGQSRLAQWCQGRLPRFTMWWVMKTEGVCGVRTTRASGGFRGGRGRSRPL